MSEETSKLARVIYRAANGSVGSRERITMQSAERIARSVRESVLMAPRLRVPVGDVLRGIGPLGNDAHHFPDSRRFE